MHCLSCKYDLRKLSENRCPECGRAFHPVEPTSYSAEASLKSHWAPAIAILCATTVVIALAMMTWNYYITDTYRSGGGDAEMALDLGDLGVAPVALLAFAIGLFAPRVIRLCIATNVLYWLGAAWFVFLAPL